MNRRTIAWVITVIALALSTWACDVSDVTPSPTAPSATETPTAPATPTSTPTIPPPPVETFTPTATSSPTVPPTPTRLPPMGNLFENPSFEGAYVQHPVENDGGQEFHAIAVGWSPFYCDVHYTPEPCPAPYAGTKNPADLLMGRPEFKPAAYPGRFRSGYVAQQWFCFFRTCNAGVYQVVDVVPGVEYEIGGWFQSWANYDGDPESDMQMPDDPLNTEFFIWVSVIGDTFAYAEENIECGHWPAAAVQGYDRFVDLSCRVVAQSSSMTIFYGAVRNFPIANNDTYVDDVYVYATH